MCLTIPFTLTGRFSWLSTGRACVITNCGLQILSVVAPDSSHDQFSLSLIVLYSFLQDRDNIIPEGYCLALYEAYACTNKLLTPWPSLIGAPQRDCINHWGIIFQTESRTSFWCSSLSVGNTKASNPSSYFQIHAHSISLLEAAQFYNLWSEWYISSWSCGELSYWFYYALILSRRVCRSYHSRKGIWAVNNERKIDLVHFRRRNGRT